MATIARKASMPASREPDDGVTPICWCRGIHSTQQYASAGRPVEITPAE